MAVIGTLLALLVFFALFGIFLTQYVPLWMTDNEAQFTAQAGTSFAQLKSFVDSQYLLGGPSVYGTSFTLSSQGVPLIAQPTQGSLVFTPTACPGGFYAHGIKGAKVSNYGQPVNSTFCDFENITLSSGPGGSGYFSDHAATGILQMTLPNRYYSGQTYYFEDDAVIQSQGGAYELVAIAPPFNVTTVAGNTSLTTSFLQVTGNASTIVAQGTQQVFSHLKFSQTLQSVGRIVNGAVAPHSLNATFEIGTPNPCAWQNFLESMMNTSGLGRPNLHPTYGTPSYNWTIPGTANVSVPAPSPICSSAAGFTTIIALNLNSVNFATVFYAGVQLTLGLGGT
ncbi:MAG TPA: hypothetical protein VEK13_04015 [Thermoplasmata archaeon]|nr:hypothetical protein [Thermoplasmata archaeon]